MKKILSVVFSFVFIFSIFSFALPAQAATLPNWNMTGTWTFNDIYGVPYVHTMVITSFNPTTGAFSGTGFYNADPSLTWAITGTESGNNVVYHLLVLTAAPGVTIDATGTINGTGTFISGNGYQSNIPGPVGTPNITWTAIGTSSPINPANKDQCKDNGWKIFTSPIFKNQGQCVSWTNHN